VGHTGHAVLAIAASSFSWRTDAHLRERYINHTFLYHACALLGGGKNEAGFGGPRALLLSLPQTQQVAALTP